MSVQLSIGSRIQVGNDRATVRFIGQVDNTKGEWLGIEWDDPQRGKHNGMHQGKKYFDCRYPTSGSFIRFHPDKVQTGISFLDALKEKYLVEEEDHGEIHIGSNKQVVVETYGFDKIQRAQRNLDTLKVVGLAEQLISSAGTRGEIAEAKLTIEDVDLSRNLLSSWEVISDIVSQLPNLEILRLNRSRLMSPHQGLTLTTLKTLSLNQTLVQWQDIQLLGSALPHLEDLQLGGNQLCQLGSIHFPQLKRLNLEDNMIDDWNQVATLATLSSLEELYLNDNRLARIGSLTNETFPKLRYLRIERNLIDNWDSLTQLNHLQSLDKLRCKDNPIFKGMDKEMEAAQIVGRIKNLSNVNGNTLTARERTDLERYYLKCCTKDGSTHQEIAAVHPRYTELCSKHGEPDLQVNTTQASAALKDRLMSITLTKREGSANELLAITHRKDLPPASTSVNKKFLRTMTIRNVKHMIQRLLKIPAAKQQLLLVQTIQQKERDIVMMDITDDLRDLKFYGINDGDELIVCQ